jgi:hypothetical protein
LALATLHLGPLEVGGLVSVTRSDVTWLCEDGRDCRAGDLIAFIRLDLHPRPEARDVPAPFADEAKSVQIALATPIAGRLRRRRESGRGGYFSLIGGAHQTWEPDEPVAAIETAEDGPAPDARLDLGLLMMPGRPVTSLARDGPGLLNGFYNRARGWRIDDEGPVGTVLSLGICELAGVMQGEQLDFREFLGAIRGPAQVVFIPDIPVAPGARIVAEQLRRTEAQRTAIREDLLDAVFRLGVTPTAEDWMFAAGVLKALESSPITDRYDVLGRGGLRKAGPPDAVVLSLHAEWMIARRHRRLGYHFQCHDYLLAEVGPAFNAWVRSNFEPVRRTLDDVRADYIGLIDQLRAVNPSIQILVCNRMATSGYEDIQSYNAFDAPLRATLASVLDKEMNLLLQDLAKERDIAIIDIDAIGAELGGRRFMADRLHQDAAIQAAARAEIIRTLNARGVPGFGPATVR